MYVKLTLFFVLLLCVVLYTYKSIEKVSHTVHNRAAYIPAQCYTKTEDENNRVHNPCFSCHINSKVPNYVDDWEVQNNNSFNEYSKINRFTNLFKDRSDLVSQIGDAEIIEYVRENNYLQKDTIILREKLSHTPSSWDFNGDGKWNGYTPDCYFNFNSEGFDTTPEGDITGWRAFGYYPFLGTFWPTNGSTDDVLIRLDKVFMLDENRLFNIEVYKLNLSIVESLIKQKSVTIEGIDEKKYGVDLNQNGTLDIANKILFKWEKPSYNAATGNIGSFSMSYVGLAKKLLENNSYLIAPGLYPKNTEFLHSVRYIDTPHSAAEKQTISMAPRMKELRYAKKTAWLSYSELSNAILSEIKEKDSFPERLRAISGNSETGLSNNLGWIYQGFIEDAKGSLRPQNYEETQYCIGCHSGIGAIADSTFVFQRKFNSEHFQKGWYHWSQDDKWLEGIAEPKASNGKNEYSLYLKLNHAADEFRTNDEAKEKFFERNGSLKTAALKNLEDDIATLLYPSITRALELNKAYKIIVEEQSYIYGRDAHIAPLKNVYKEIDLDRKRAIIEPFQY